MMIRIQKVLYMVFIQSWWIIAFILFCTTLYEQGLRARDTLFQQLTQKKIALEREKQEVLQKQQNLQLQINSQSDLAWVELTLMKGLGLTPEDQQKVYFYPDERCHGHRHPSSSDKLSISLE